MTELDCLAAHSSTQQSHITFVLWVKACKYKALQQSLTYQEQVLNMSVVEVDMVKAIVTH